MSKQNKFFNQKELDTKNAKISSVSSVNISGKNLITGDEKGNLRTYEISEDNKLNLSKEVNLKSKIEKICIPENRRIAFILSGGDIHYTNIPNMDNTKALFNSRDIVGLYLNKDDPKFENSILVMQKKDKIIIKIYDYEIDKGKIIINEHKTNTQLFLDFLPKCVAWIEDNFLVFDKNNKIYRYNCNTGETIDDNVGFDNAVEIFSLGGKIAVSSTMYSLFMKNGKSYPINPLMHFNDDFHCFCEFKNHLIALYNNNIGIYKLVQQTYEQVETINFDAGQKSKFMVVSRYKLIVLTESGDKTIFLDMQERPYQEQVKSLIDQKLYDKAIDKLLENIPEDDLGRQSKVENVFLDCGWACLEGQKKDYQNSIKYLSLTNFNPFEFIYMFLDEFKINIIHDDKKDDIINKKKENQFFLENPGEPVKREAYKFLIKLLKSKRDYILEKKIKSNNCSEIYEIKFKSSERSKINLEKSSTEITIRDALNAINSTLIKSLIKVKEDPKEIEAVLDNESINYSRFDDFENDEFFKDKKNINLDETKFTLFYIYEKKGNDYEKVLEQWKTFGESNNKNYSLIGKGRTKKIFYKFKDNRNIDRDKKEELFKKYIKWLLEKYREEAFELILKTEIVSPKIFIDEIIPDFIKYINNKGNEKEKEKEKKEETAEDIKEKYLEYCNNSQNSEFYQTQILELYADKLFKFNGKDKAPEKIEGDIKKYYDLLMDIIKNEESVYDKKSILKYIDNSWLKEPRIYLCSRLKEYKKALQELFEDSKKTKSFKEIEEFCKKNNDPNEKIFESFYKILGTAVKEYQQKIEENKKKIIELEKELKEKNNELNEDDKKNKENEKKKLENDIAELEKDKKPFEDEMLYILKEYGNIDDNIDPIVALDYANDELNICECKEFFNYLTEMVKDFTVRDNKNKISKNLSEIGLLYKKKEEYEFNKKYTIIDSDKVCDLCRKKIGSTIFVVYPNLRVYHSKCAPNNSIDPMTGINFMKKKFIE